MQNPLRIAIWSGPRNVSTAMMRSFSSRKDTAVLDEPFYAHYLKRTGISHPGHEKVIEAYETDWGKILRFISGPIPARKSIWYQKHMAHHMLLHKDCEPLLAADYLTHAFLIRDPGEVINSYTKVQSEMSLGETGLPYQVDLFNRLKELTGRISPVIDAKDVLLDSRRTLSRLCGALGIEFSESMLAWPAGPHSDDGNWAIHWYSSVYRSTGFQPYQMKNETVAPKYQKMLAKARKFYDELAAYKL
jgi:hypothetical protein